MCMIKVYLLLLTKHCKINELIGVSFNNCLLYCRVICGLCNFSTKLFPGSRGHLSDKANLSLQIEWPLEPGTTVQSFEGQFHIE